MLFKTTLDNAQPPGSREPPGPPQAPWGAGAAIAWTEACARGQILAVLLNTTRTLGPPKHSLVTFRVGWPGFMCDNSVPSVKL